MPPTNPLTTEFFGEFLKWKSCDPFLHHTQCIIGQLSCKLKDNKIPLEVDRNKTAVTIANLWERWFLHLEKEFPNISFFIELQEFAKRDLFAFGIPENQELIWKEIPIILENIKFLFKPLIASYLTSIFLKTSSLLLGIRIIQLSSHRRINSYNNLRKARIFSYFLVRRGRKLCCFCLQFRKNSSKINKTSLHP